MYIAIEYIIFLVGVSRLELIPTPFFFPPFLVISIFNNIRECENIKNSVSAWSDCFQRMSFAARSIRLCRVLSILITRRVSYSFVVIEISPLSGSGLIDLLNI